MTFVRDKKNKTIKSVLVDQLCNGCGTCSAVCPVSAISIQEDKIKGIYMPILSASICTNCSLCYKVCPGHSVDFIKYSQQFLDGTNNDPLLGQYEQIYTGYSNNANIRWNASSGGIITDYLLHLLDEKIIDGAVVTRMDPKEPLRPEPIIARTREEILTAIGSKYCPVPTNIIVKKILEQEGKYAIVGLPCHIQGLRKAEVFNNTLRERIILQIGIFCGTTKTFLGTEYLLSKKNLTNQQIESIKYRGNGWPGYMQIQVKNQNDSVFIPYLEYYDDEFTSFTPWRCHLCVDQTAELADVSFGDAWLKEISDKDSIGTSIIISRAQIADKILQEMESSGKINLDVIDHKKVAQSQGDFLRRQEFKSWIVIAKLLGRKIPKYELSSPTRDSQIYDYIKNGIILSKELLNSNRSTWKIFEKYCLLLRYIFKFFK